MSLGNPKSGLNNAAVFQVSGDPWVTASIATTTAQEVTFGGKFCKAFTLHNTGSNNTIRVGFSQNGLTKTNNFFRLGSNDSYSGDFRVPGLWLMTEGGNAEYELVASLTVVDAADTWIITGSSQADTGNVRHKGMGGVG